MYLYARFLYSLQQTEHVVEEKTATYRLLFRHFLTLNICMREGVRGITFLHGQVYSWSFRYIIQREKVRSMTCWIMSRIKELEYIDWLFNT